MLLGRSARQGPLRVAFVGLPVVHTPVNQAFESRYVTMHMYERVMMIATQLVATQSYNKFNLQELIHATRWLYLSFNTTFSYNIEKSFTE